MAQTILDEYIAAWEETEQQPDPTRFGFDGLLDMLTQANDAMMELGESANRHKREVQQANATIERLRAELEAEQARTICAMCGNELTEKSPAK